MGERRRGPGPGTVSLIAGLRGNNIDYALCAISTTRQRSGQASLKPTRSVLAGVGPYPSRSWMQGLSESPTCSRLGMVQSGDGGNAARRSLPSKVDELYISEMQSLI